MSASRWNSAPVIKEKNFECMCCHRAEHPVRVFCNSEGYHIAECEGCEVALSKTYKGCQCKELKLVKHTG